MSGISTTDLKLLIKASYDPIMEDVGKYKLDHSLSGQRAKVFFNESNGKAYIAHRGTKGVQDVITDTKMIFNYKNNERFNHAQKIQKMAENKYGKDNVITIGHSLGASIASDVGSDSKQIINLNKPVLPSDMLFKDKNKNQTDINTSYDPVSFMRSFERKNGNEVNIASQTINPFTEHTANVLDRLGSNTIIGGSVEYDFMIRIHKNKKNKLNKNKY